MIERLRQHRWEVLLVLLILAAGAWAASVSPYYLNLDQVLFSVRHVVIAGVLALGLMVVVILGDIDISLPSIVGVGTVLLAEFSSHGVGLAIALPVVILVGAAVGGLNGLLVTRFVLPSLAVTLGTMGAVRAVAFLIGGDGGYAGFDATYVWLGSAVLWGIVPVSVCLFAVLALAFAFLMHCTVFGRQVYAVGHNAEAAAYSGVRVGAVKIAAFVLAGAMAALASLVFVGQYGSAKADNAQDVLLFVVTAVVLGGVDILGGRGKVAGVVLAILLLATLSTGMGLVNVSGPLQTVVVGSLLIGAVLMSRAGERLKQAADRRRLSRVPSAS
jgi:rhamnose transport system permease protein